MTGTAPPLLALGEALGIEPVVLKSVERPREIHHQFAVRRADVQALPLAIVTAVLEEYGSAISLEFRIGDLIEISIDSTSSQDAIERFVRYASTDYELVIRLNKSILIKEKGLQDSSAEVYLYLFTDALSSLLQQGLTSFESELWHDASRPLRIYLMDSITSLVGPWLSIVSDPTRSVDPSDGSDRLRQVRELRDRFIGWDETWVKQLTPSHVWTTGETDHATLEHLLVGQFVTLALLYFCDRARTHTPSQGAREIRAEFRGGPHVAAIPVPEGLVLDGVSESNLQALFGLYEWVYSIDAIGRNQVTDRLPFVQTRVAQVLEGRPEENRLDAFLTSATYLMEGIEWQWKAFIEGKISAYLENRKELETAVGDAVISFRERAADLTKQLGENMLAAVGVLVGTFIAATFDDPFNAALFQIGIRIYGLYLLIFPGATGLFSQSIRFKSARTDFDERMKSFKRLLGSEVDDVVGQRVNQAARDYWLWTAFVGLIYLAVAIAAFIAADRIPPLIKN